jgi:hypothetical protein
MVRRDGLVDELRLIGLAVQARRNDGTLTEARTALNEDYILIIKDYLRVRRHSGLCSRADIATIGFAISLVTSASVLWPIAFLFFA